MRSRPQTSFSSLSVDATIEYSLRTYRVGMRWTMSVEASPPASIKKTEKPLVARLALSPDQQP